MNKNYYVDIYSPDFDEDDYTEEELDIIYRRRQMNNEKSLASLFIYKIIYKYTDTKHHLTQAKIAQILREYYGIKLERKAVGRIIHLLSDVFPDICCSPIQGVWQNTAPLEEITQKHLCA